LGLVGVVTVGLLSANLVLLVESYGSPFRFAGKLVTPALVLGALYYARHVLVDPAATDDDVLRFGLLYAVSAPVFGTAAGLTVLYIEYVGGTVVEAESVVLHWALAGVFAGTVLGSYEVRHRLASRRQTNARQRAAILNRVLRHDLRNGSNVVLGSLDFMTAETPAEERAMERIRARIDRLNRTAERARYIGETTDGVERQVSDVAEIVREHVETLAAEYPDAIINVAAPESADVLASPLIGPALFEPLENAMLHNDGDRTNLDVTVVEGNGRVTVEVADDGPGLPELEGVVFDGGEESSLEHSRGTGLWFLTLTVRSSGGETSVENGEGLTLSVTLPAAS
jgi:signal transduction histidine kinase